MQRRLTWGAHHVGIDGDAWDPYQPVAREHQGPGVALFTRHASVDEDVLELPGAAAAKRAHRQARPSKPEVHVETGLQVHGFVIVATDASSHFKARARSPLL